MKQYSLFLIAAFFGTTNLFVRCSDDVHPFTFSTMAASLYPLEHTGYKNMRSVMDRLVREGANRPITECPIKLISGFSWNKRDGWNVSVQSCCCLTTKKEGDAEVVIASRIEDAVAQEVHVFVCGTIDKRNDDGVTIDRIKQATMVATTYIGSNDPEARSRTCALVGAAIANLKKCGYKEVALNCGRVETDDLFLGCGINAMRAPLSVYDKTCALFDPAYCPALTCSKLACTEHTN